MEAWLLREVDGCWQLAPGVPIWLCTETAGRYTKNELHGDTDVIHRQHHTATALKMHVRASETSDYFIHHSAAKQGRSTAPRPPSAPCSEAARPHNAVLAQSPC